MLDAYGVHYLAFKNSV